MTRADRYRDLCRAFAPSLNRGYVGEMLGNYVALVNLLWCVVPRNERLSRGCNLETA